MFRRVGLLGIAFVSFACASSTPAADEEEATKDELVVGGRLTNPIPLGFYDGVVGRAGTIQVGTGMTSVEIDLPWRAATCDSAGDVRDGKVFVRSTSPGCEASVTLAEAGGTLTVSGTYKARRGVDVETLDISGAFARRGKDALVGMYAPKYRETGAVEVTASADDRIALTISGRGAKVDVVATRVQREFARAILGDSFGPTYRGSAEGCDVVVIPSKQDRMQVALKADDKCTHPAFSGATFLFFEQTDYR